MAHQPALGQSAARQRTLGIISGLNFCPPKPGSTVSTSTRSAPASTAGAAASAPLLGLSATPACMPIALMRPTSDAASLVASAWKVKMLAPACTAAVRTNADHYRQIRVAKLFVSRPIAKCPYPYAQRHTPAP